MNKKLFFTSLTILAGLLNSCNNNSLKSNSQSTSINSETIVSDGIPSAKLDSIVKSVISVSASDFYKNQRPEPVDFKDVKLKYIKKPSGEELYILCGQFITNDKQVIDFATVKNSDYEQWIGNSASTYCTNSKVIPCTENLSISLKNKFNSLKK